MLAFYEKVPRHFLRISLVMRVLPSRVSEIRGAIVRIAKTNTILKRPVNKLFAVENTYHDTNQTDKASHREIASPFPLLSCELWIFVKENPDRKKANYTLQHLRINFPSMMGEESLNALWPVYIRRDTFLDYDKIIDIYASKHSRRMLLINPLSEN